ncbi:MAG: AAA family ATPase [Oscillospiraceae bacterium]|nr:AAA family ATPase [Oscillospiraceae bacterium]
MEEKQAHKAKIIAVAGKGGVGKTSLCSAIVRVLVEAHPGARILAIDADPAIGLSTALGIKVEHTIDDIRNEVIETSERGEYRQAIEVLNEARFRIFDTMVECEGFAFLAIGRPEAAGCYCSVNSYLKEVINMLAGDFDYVVIDGEAGIEQISRRVMDQVTHLLLITDQSAKGVRVCEEIKQVADELITYERVGAIVNRVVDPAMNEHIQINGVEILAFVPTDAQHAANDIQGKSVFALPEDAFVISGVKDALHKIEII